MSTNQPAASSPAAMPPPPATTLTAITVPAPGTIPAGSDPTTSQPTTPRPTSTNTNAKKVALPVGPTLTISILSVGILLLLLVTFFGWTWGPLILLGAVLLVVLIYLWYTGKLGLRGPGRGGRGGGLFGPGRGGRGGGLFGGGRGGRGGGLFGGPGRGGKGSSGGSKPGLLDRLFGGRGGGGRKPPSSSTGPGRGSNPAGTGRGGPGKGGPGKSTDKAGPAGGTGKPRGGPKSDGGGAGPKGCVDPADGKPTKTPKGKDKDKDGPKDAKPGVAPPPPPPPPAVEEDLIGGEPVSNDQPVGSGDPDASTYRWIDGLQRVPGAFEAMTRYVEGIASAAAQGLPVHPALREEIQTAALAMRTAYEESLEWHNYARTTNSRDVGRVEDPRGGSVHRESKADAGRATGATRTERQ